MTSSVRILIPLDGSQLAEHSLAYISALKPLGLSQVEIVSAVEPETVRLRRGHEDEQRERNLLAAYHRELAEDIRAHTAVDVETKLLSGHAAQAIIEEAEAFDPDYLIVSTHGASGMSRWRFGSVADKVIRGAHCPTLVLGPKSAERDQWLTERLMPAFKDIVVPLDGSETGEQALPVAQLFAEAFGANIHLVSVVAEDIEALLARIGATGGDAPWAGASPELTESLTKEAKEYIERVSGQTPGLDKAILAVRIGDASQALTDYVTAGEIDLVIMASHGRGGLVRAALGSTTDRLLGGPAPVLVVRARA